MRGRGHNFARPKGLREVDGQDQGSPGEREYHHVAGEPSRAQIRGGVFSRVYRLDIQTCRQLSLRMPSGLRGDGRQGSGIERSKGHSS